MKKLLTVFLFVLFGCNNEPSYKSGSHTEQNMNSVSAGVELPVSLWSLLEGVSKTKDSDEPLPTKFIGLKVYLTEKNRGILNGQNYLLNFSEGGGELDLADFLSSKHGSFYIAIEPVIKIPPEASKPNLDVFYLSNASKRRLGNEAVGAGCNTYHKITSFIHKAMKQDGILVNTTAGRHVSTLAGTYFFAIPFGERLHLAHLTIKDSRFRSIQCRR